MNKDNLTDVVETLPQIDVPVSDTGNVPQSSPQQVVNSDGETITLGQNKPK